MYCYTCHSRIRKVPVEIYRTTGRWKLLNSWACWISCLSWNRFGPFDGPAGPCSINLLVWIQCWIEGSGPETRHSHTHIIITLHYVALLNGRGIWGTGCVRTFKYLNHEHVCETRTRPTLSFTCLTGSYTIS